MMSLIKIQYQKHFIQLEFCDDHIASTVTIPIDMARNLFTSLSEAIEKEELLPDDNSQKSDEEWTTSSSA